MHALKGRHKLDANRPSHSRATGFTVRETYKRPGPDKFIEVVEFAEPGKDVELYGEGHFKHNN